MLDGLLDRFDDGFDEGMLNGFDEGFLAGLLDGFAEGLLDRFKDRFRSGCLMDFGSHLDYWTDCLMDLMTDSRLGFDFYLDCSTD